MNRRMATLLVALVPVVVLAVLGSIVKVPFAALGPGPTFNTLGDVEVEGKDVPVVDITGVPLDPTSGHLNMTTVSVRDGLNVFEALGFWASGRQGLVPRSEVYPPDKSRDEIDKTNKADFAESESHAEQAAAHYLKYPVTVSVANVSTDAPANSLLKKDDQLISFNDVAVTSVKQVQDVVSGVKPGGDVVVKYRRDGVENSVPIKLAARPDDASKGYLGITPVEKSDVPFKVAFNLADIGGPSAGLMFTLAVIDKLTPGELSNDSFVAGTGTMDDADGNVGPIGGIPFKMVAAREAGATTFLVPAKNCDEAKQHAPDGLRLVKVTQLSDAVTSLKAIGKGDNNVPSCG